VAVRLLPLDAWAGLGGTTTTGRPTSAGELLVAVGQDGIRLGTVTGGMVTGAVELRSRLRLGALSLAEPDGAGGYLCVVRATYEAPAGNQFLVIHVGPDLAVRAFAVASADFADAATTSRFRLGPDGRLYQMRSSPDGLRIVRFDLEEVAA
jgi:hypothetical protein